MDRKKIQRINELAHKAKSEGLTDAEIHERDILRKEYLKSIRESMKAQLDSIEYVDDPKRTLN